MSSSRPPLATKLPGPTPGRAAAFLARGAIEEVLLGIPAIPLEMDRAGIGDRLRRAIQCAYAVIDSDALAPVHHDALAEAAALVREARALLAEAGPPRELESLAQALDGLDTAGATLARGAEDVAQIQYARRSELRGAGPGAGQPPPRPFRASLGTPSLHAFARRPLMPDLSLDPVVPLVEQQQRSGPTLERPETLDALKALAATLTSGEIAKRLADREEDPPAPRAVEPPPPVYEPAITEVDMLRRLARDCLEDIAIHSDLRRPNAIESWVDQAPFEQRLLDNMDCFASLGGSALPLVSIFHAEAKAPDAGRAFAAALALGCIEGVDTVGAAVMMLKQSPPEELPGWFEGFWLAPSPAVDAAMLDLCTSARPELVGLALDVLHARGSTPDELIPPLLERAEPLIARRVARALATALPRSEAIDHLEQLSATAEDDVFLAAVESLLRRGVGRAADLLRRAVDAPASPERRRRALPLLCVAGRAGDLDRLLAAATADPTPRLVRSLGRFGHVHSLPALLGLLEHEERELVAAAAEALDRITGAGLREVVEEPWEIELPAEAAEAGGIPVPTRRVERIVTDPGRWSAWLNRNARRLDARIKTRAGAPFAPLRIVDELEATVTPPDRREEAALELALLTGISTTFSPHDWVARQRVDLATLRSQVASTGVTPGTWSLALATEVERPAAHLASAPPAPPPAVDEEPEIPPPSTADPDAIAAFRQVLPFTHPGGEPPRPADPAQERGRDSALPFRPAERPSAQRRSPPPQSERPAAPVLSLAQYASLCAELAMFPEAAEAVFRRYGLDTQETRSAVDGAWKERLGSDPAAHRAWQELYRRCCASWAARGARGKLPKE